MVGVFLAYESVLRFFEPSDIGAWAIIIISGVALTVDVLTVVLLYAMRKGSVNVRAAFMHNLSDALASVAVLVGGVAILLSGVTWIDPLLSLLIVAYIFYQVAQLLPGTVRLLMESAPEGLTVEDLVRRMESVDGVQGVHHLHVWQLDEHENALEAHVVIARDDAQKMDHIKAKTKRLLKDEFGVTHPMLEIEFATTAEKPDHDISIIADH